MKAWVERSVHGWWSGSGGLTGRMMRVLATPAEILFRIGVGIRSRAYDAGLFRVHRVPATVVSVGNLVVGGTGKTPVSAWLVRELAGAGRATAIVTRGYGRDEVELHRRWNPTIPVYVGRDRVQVALEAVQRDREVLVLDDGFQHRRLRRDLDVVLLAAEQPFPGRLLPAGPYREGPSALRRAHVAFVTYRVAPEGEATRVASRITAEFPHLEVGILRLAASGWADLQGHTVEAPSGALTAVTSVARPGDFQRMVGEVTGTRPVLLAFPDHHEFSSEDIDAIRRAAGDSTVVTTEKDAVKLSQFVQELPRVRVLALRVEPGGGAAAVLQRILEVTSKPRHRPAGAVKP